MLPGKLGGVNHSVHAAQIHKRTVAGHALDHALIHLAVLDVLPELLLAGIALLLQNLADGALCLLVVLDLNDLHGHGLTHQRVQIAVARHAGMCGGNEDLIGVDQRHDAALVDQNDLTLDSLLRLVGFLDLLPVLVGVNALLGECSEAIDIADTDHESLHLIPDFEHLIQLRRRIIRNLIQLDNAGHLGSQVELNLAGRDRGHDPYYGISCLYCFEC